MKKILYFVDRLLPGGVQSFLKTLSKELPKDEYKIDFLVLDDGNDYSKYEKEYLDLGVSIHKLDGIWIRHLKDYKPFEKKLDAFFKENKFDIVHINSGPKNYVVAKYAKKCGTKMVVYHSHNTDYQTKNIIKKVYGNSLKKKVAKYSTDYLACSFEAGQWMYSKKILNSDSFKIIHNPIIVKDFAFDENERAKLRKEMGFTDDFVIGNIGRLSKQKNQKFLIQIMSELVKKCPNAKLALVGQGELKNELEDLTKELGLSNNVSFLGFRSDVNKLLNSFDLIVMSSFFEGYPIVSIEAQANGLPCLMSDTITKEALLKDNSNMLSLNDSPEKWAEYILDNYINKKNDRVAPKSIEQYDSSYIVKQLMELYCKE